MVEQNACVILIVYMSKISALSNLSNSDSVVMNVWVLNAEKQLIKTDMKR